MAWALIGNIKGPAGPQGPQGEGGTSLYSETWTWTTKVTDATNPGQIGINDVTWAASTTVHINEKTTANRDMAGAFSVLFKEGNELYVQQKTDSARYGRYQISGPPVDNGVWWTFPVTFVEGSGSPPGGNADTVVTVLVTASDTGGGDTIIDGIGPPTTGIGNDGDYYIDHSGYAMYGPKDSAALDAPRFTNVDTDTPSTTMNTGAGSYRLGMEYKFLVAGQISGARWRREATSDAVGRQLYLHKSDGTYVASTAFTVETAGVAGWVRASFTPPIILNINDQFVVSFDMPAGPAGYTAPPGPTMLDTSKVTYIQARYISTPTGTAFPSTVQANVNRFADIEFRPAGGSIWPVALPGDVIGEVPGGALSGVNAIYSTASPFVTGSLAVFLNGVRQKAGADYTVTGTNTFQMTSPPLSGDLLLVDYLKG